MDPKACLCALLDALEVNDRESAIEHLDALSEWLKKGGAFPRLLGRPS